MENIIITILILASTCCFAYAIFLATRINTKINNIEKYIKGDVITIDNNRKLPDNFFDDIDDDPEKDNEELIDRIRELEILKSDFESKVVEHKKIKGDKI